MRYSLSDLRSEAHRGSTGILTLWLPVPGHRKVCEVRSISQDYWVTTGRRGDWITESWACHGGTYVYSTKVEAEEALAAEVARVEAWMAKMDEATR